MERPSEDWDDFVPSDLRNLVTLFHNPVGQLAYFEPIEEKSLSEPFRTLLVHRKHMTVTVEKYHHCLVDLKVLAKRVTTAYYARKIVLTRQTDGAVVQYGIMRIKRKTLRDTLWQAVEDESAPLGRLLTGQGVLRDVEVIRVYRVLPEEELCQLFGHRPGTITYGRSARIRISGHAVVELLEIIAPI